MPTASAPDAAPSKLSARDRAGGAIQKAFLDDVIKNNTRVAIFLVNGVRLEGEIKSYDRYVILMKNAVTDKVYKHAVSTIMPSGGGQPTAAGAAAERQGVRGRRPPLTSGRD